MLSAQQRSGIKAVKRSYVMLPVLALMWLTVRLGWAQEQAPAEPPTALQNLSQSLDALVARVSPSVVQVLVTGYQPVEKGGEEDTGLIGRQRSLGSGVIIDPDGYIMTNAHVVKGAERVRVVLTAPMGPKSQVEATLGRRQPPVEAKVVGIAPSLDLALLKISVKGLPALPLADYSKARKGQLVLAFGSPQGLENSVTMGIISSVARQPDPDVPMVYIQTDAPINPGNSGGPLVDTDGRIVGINTLILTESGGSQGLGFAVPSSVVAYAYEQLREHGHVRRLSIGVRLQDITSDLATGLGLAQQEGVLISDVKPGSPAERAGLRIQDILLSLDGKLVESVPLAEMIISTRPPGSSAKVEVLRDKQKITFSIPVIEQPPQVDELEDLIDPQESLVDQIGIFGMEINDKMARQLPDLRIPSGVIVLGLVADQMTTGADLQQGDVIHAVNDKRVTSLERLRTLLKAVPRGGACVLQVERDGNLTFVTFEMDSWHQVVEP